jgi:hypothetical protein
VSDHELLIRITIEAAPAGVAWALQSGRDELLPPSGRSKGLTFEATVRVVTGADGAIDFRGRVVQGPRNGRFIYLNSGTRAGQADSPWDRRAKVSLEGLKTVLSRKGVAAASGEASVSFAGTDPRGGPACASVPLMGSGWHLEPRKATR